MWWVSIPVSFECHYRHYRHYRHCHYLLHHWNYYHYHYLPPHHHDNHDGLEKNPPSWVCSRASSFVWDLLECLYLPRVNLSVNVSVADYYPLLPLSQKKAL